MRSAFRAAVIVCGISTALAPSALAAPQVAVTRFPRGIMQPVNGAQEHDDFVIANSGPDAANVTVIGTRQFFNVSPSQFVLDPRTSRTITIQPVVTAGGLYARAGNGLVAGGKGT